MMARLNEAIIDDSGDELPEIDEILGSSGGDCTGTPSRPNRKEQPSRIKLDRVNWEKSLVARNQTEHSGFSAKSNVDVSRKTSIRSSPRRIVKFPSSYAQFLADSSEDETTSAEDSGSYTDLSGFIVSDTESIETEDSKTSSETGCRKLVRKPGKNEQFAATKLGSGSSSDQGAPAVTDLKSPSKERQKFNEIEAPSISSSSSSSDPERRLTPFVDLHQPAATLRFSPPQCKSPHKLDPKPIVNPPASPSKSKLQSPSKRARIPATPHRPSINAFWSQEVVDEWNDRYSPAKTPLSTYRSKSIILDTNDEDLSPSVALCKSPLKSATKRDKAATERRRLFDKQKGEIATAFLAEVDRIISGGKVSSLAESTDGIKIIWSKKLSSTAGRANWRREAIRQRSAESTDSAPTMTAHRHHASIELAEKVIDDEHRLINVIAHEYCHLANFMISGIKNNPHGKEFKQWAAKCTRAFKHQGVEVTTKHSYDISYKYIWQCSEASCGLEYKRHSKSIDPSKQACGACKSKLLQIQPAPKKGVEVGKRSEYQEFVKAGYERVKRERPGIGFGEVMAVLGREFREKKRVEAETSKEKDVLRTEDAGVDGVLKELDELRLG